MASGSRLVRTIKNESPANACAVGCIDVEARLLLNAGGAHVPGDTDHCQQERLTAGPGRAALWFHARPKRRPIGS